MPACPLAAAGCSGRCLADIMAGAPADKAIEIRLNGEPQTIGSPATVATLVVVRQPRPPFSVEVNKQLVRRPCYGTTELNDGDQVEIVTLVGGG